MSTPAEPFLQVQVDPNPNSSTDILNDPSYHPHTDENKTEQLTAPIIERTAPLPAVRRATKQCVLGYVPNPDTTLIAAVSAALVTRRTLQVLHPHRGINGFDVIYEVRPAP